TTLYRYLYFCKYLKYNRFYYALQKFISIFTGWSIWLVFGAQWDWFIQSMNHLDWFMHAWK
ncbi:MAG: hypothetical protein OQJ81_00695, partial [Melioribacteraceae bacterium]|nr:hypothetical protein [Melioribacteraceae bacterium]